MRGEYVYAAEGTGGLKIYDAASVGNKDYSQAVVQGAQLPASDASCVALPTNQPIDPKRNQGALMRTDNQEQAFHPIYNYALITDRREGLILTDVTTLGDANPRNHVLRRALTFNPDGVLNGARYLTIGGHIVYVIADAGLVILNLDNPLAPTVLSIVPLQDGRAAALQFRYLFVTDATGLQTVDVTDPGRPHLLPDNRVELKDAQRVYAARTYAYVAAGKQGLAIIDAERPAKLQLLQLFDAGGTLHDARDVVVASTNASLFAYVADGAQGLKVLQLTSPQSQPKFYGFSPVPKPELIATYATKHAALSLSKGLDRDRGVDETGHQIAVFGRRGSAPFGADEMRKLYLDIDGNPWFAKPLEVH
jgi:LVIVD repeat